MVVSLLRVICISVLAVVTSGCANLVFGYGKINASAPYAALKRETSGLDKTVGEPHTYVSQITLHQAPPDGCDRVLRRESEESFSLPMMLINLFPGSCITAPCGELARIARDCYRLPPGQHKLTVTYQRDTVTDIHSGASIITYWGHRNQFNRTFTATIQAGKRYHLTPEIPDRLLTEEQWKEHRSSGALTPQSMY